MKKGSERDVKGQTEVNHPKGGGTSMGFGEDLSKVTGTANMPKSETSKCNTPQEQETV